MTLSEEQQSHLDEAALAAAAMEAKYKLPTRLSIAQWAQESGWGAHQPQCNCFGIKAYEGCWGTQTRSTTEYFEGKARVIPQLFATFPNLESCFERRALLLATHREYAPGWTHYLQSNDIEQLARDIGKVYATDPLYAPHLITLMREPVVIEAAARAQQTIYSQLQSQP